MLVSAIGKFNAAKIANNTNKQNTFNGDYNLIATSKCRKPCFDKNKIEQNNKNFAANRLDYTV